jgi:hypothetical protein
VLFPATPRPRVPFTFSAAVETAHAVLQSFHLQVDDSDSNVRDVQVSLTTFFDPVQSPTSGEVEVEIRRTGSDGSIFLESDTIQAEIRILVIGI